MIEFSLKIHKMRAEQDNKIDAPVIFSPLRLLLTDIHTAYHFYKDYASGSNGSPQCLVST